MSKRKVEKKMKKTMTKKMKRENKRKKQTLAESEFKEKRKKLLERRKEEKQRENKRKKLKSIAEGAYWARVWKSDGFDGEGLDLKRLPPIWRKMLPYKCGTPNDCPPIVRLYAKTGLHRYNMLGTNLQLPYIEKYNRLGACFIGPSSYYITLVAKNPATDSFVTFETSSHEKMDKKLNVWFYIARLQDTGTTKGTLWHDQTATQFYHVRVPKWPSVIDKKHFYLVQESELIENDWIRLYLELGFVTTNRQITNPELSDLKIVEVMVETEENVQLPMERLEGFKDATLYIKYVQDLGKGQVCKCRAIIKRSVDLRTERMGLNGDYYLESQADSYLEASTDIKAPEHITGPVKETKSSSDQQQMDFLPIKPIPLHQRRSIKDRKTSSAHQIQLNNRFGALTSCAVVCS